MTSKQPLPPSRDGARRRPFVAVSRGVRVTEHRMGPRRKRSPRLRHLAALLLPLGLWLRTVRPAPPLSPAFTPRDDVAGLGRRRGRRQLRHRGRLPARPDLRRPGRTRRHLAPAALASTFATSIVGVATYALLSLAATGDVAPTGCWVCPAVPAASLAATSAHASSRTCPRRPSGFCSGPLPPASARSTQSRSCADRAEALSQLVNIPARRQPPAPPASQTGVEVLSVLGFWHDFREARTLSDGRCSNQASGSCLKTTGADLGVVDSVASWKRHRLPWGACCYRPSRTCRCSRWM